MHTKLYAVNLKGNCRLGVFSVGGKVILNSFCMKYYVRVMTAFK